MVNVFDITEFGAIGDGKTDSTEAIQKAMDAAKDCMGKVVVPPGKYLVQGDLKLRGEGVSLEGSSAWSFRNDGASVFILDNENAECMIDISGAFGCTIKGMCLNGRRLGKDVHGIKLYWERYNGGGQEDTPTIDDCRIGLFSGDGLHFERVWCFSVRHSMIYTNGGSGLNVAGWDAFIIDNWFTNNAVAGIKNCGYVASITATGNRVEWNRTAGFWFDRGDSFNFTGNFFDRTYGPSLKLGCSDGEFNLASCTGNVFRRSGAYDTPHQNKYWGSHLLLENCTGCVFTGNSMKVGAGDGGTMPISPDYGVVMKNCKDSIVKDNAMRNGAVIENLVIGENENCIIENNIGSIFSEDN